MMTLPEVLSELEAYSNENTKRILMRHGAREPFFGVKVQDLKKILKKTKKDHALALELYATGHSDAMYLAGLMADAKQITREELQDWAEKAYWYMLSEYAVAGVAAESPLGFELGLEWISSDQAHIASAGWATLAGYASIRPDEELNLAVYQALLHQVADEVHSAQNRVRYTMNGFVIAIGSYITSLNALAQQVATQIGKVEVKMGGTACKVPLAGAYLQKMMDKGRIGKKRKHVRC